LPEIIRNFVGHARFTLRIVPSNLEAKISILDKKEMNMAVFPESEIGEAALWSDNPCLVSMAAEYFETIWQRGIDVDLEKDA